MADVTWQAFVETQLLASNACAQACILSAEDGMPWAYSADFVPRRYPAQVMQDDGTEVPTDIDERKLLSQLMLTGSKGPEGLRINAKKYMVVRTTPSPLTIYGKVPQGGACLTRTEKTIVIGTYQEGVSSGPGACNVAVEKLGEYLREKGF